MLVHASIEGRGTTRMMMAPALALFVSVSGCVSQEVRPITERTILSDQGQTTTIVDTKIRQYEDLARDFPKEPKYLERLSEMYHSRNDYRTALQYIEKAQRLDPENPRYYFQEGRIYIGIGNFRMAETAYQKMVALTPEAKFTGPHMEMAHLYLAMERPELAEQQFARCVEIDPTFPLPHFHLGELALARRATDQAVEHFEQYLSKGGQRFQEETLQRLYALQPGVVRRATAPLPETPGPTVPRR